MSMILVINDQEIKSALEITTRQYLAGELSRPQLLGYFHDQRIEIGITHYENFHSELPHYHTKAAEYQYMLNGMTEYWDLDCGEKYIFKKGDFYKISPGTKYVQKSKPGTTILFIKTPSGNDKMTVDVTDEIKRWMESKIKTVRKDYTCDANAPKPNSIKPAAAVALLNEHNEILLVKRADNAKWTMPGGTLNIGEDLITCATREVLEELGLEIEIKDIIGTYTNPNTVIEYSDGEIRQEFAIVYLGEILDGAIQLDLESTEFKWVNLEEVLDLPLADSQRRRLMDVITYHKFGTRHFK